MPVERRPFVASIVILLALLAMALTAGCRTRVRGKVEPDSGVKTADAAVETSEVAALPANPTKALVAERCLLCHGAALITQQRKDAAAWGRTVTQMRAWGTPIQDADQAALVAYLARHFGTAPAKR
jgi:cytochrome c5